MPSCPGSALRAGLSPRGPRNLMATVEEAAGASSSPGSGRRWKSDLPGCSVVLPLTVTGHQASQRRESGTAPP